MKLTISCYMFTFQLYRFERLILYYHVGKCGEGRKEEIVPPYMMEIP